MKPLQGILYAMTIVLAGCGSAEKPTESASEDDATAGLPMAVQLWSVRDALTADFDGTLAAIADMGFDGIEIYPEHGPYHEDGAAFRARLDELGLRVSSAHVPFEAMSAEQLPATVEFYRTIDVSTLIIAWDDRAWDPDRIDELVADLNAAATRLAAFDMRVGYHNHDGEFGDFAGATFWDYLAKETDPSVMLQLDVGWVVNARKDPASFIGRNPDRIISMHYKSLPREGEDVSPILGQD
ncbi:MAG: sugar phosphate isomerase/epimerase, partial [Pseudomonadota bacterium]